MAETESLILKIDASQAITSADAFTLAVLKSEQAAVLADRQIRALEVGFSRLANGQDRANRIAAITARQIASLRGETETHTRAVVAQIASVERAVAAQTRHIDVLTRAVVELRSASSAQKELGDSASAASSKVGSLSAATRGFLQTALSLAGGLSAAVAIRSLISNSASLETAMVGVQKTTNLTDDEMQIFRGRIDEIASRTPVATASLLDIAQAAGQLGVRGVDSLARFSETVAKLQSATDIRGADGSKMLARLIGINGEDVGTAIEGVGAAITRLGNESRASESEILANAETVAQSTAQYKIGSLNALALGAAMKSLGTDAEIGGTAVGRSMDAIDKAIRKPGPELEVLKKLTGQTGDEIESLFRTDPTAQFARFIGGLNAAGKAGEDVKGILAALGLEDIRIARVLPTLGGAYGELAAAIAKARDEGVRKLALDAEAARAQETLSSKAREAANVVGNLAERGFRPVNSVLKGFLDAVRGVNVESPTLAAGIGSVTAALGALAAARAIAYVGQLAAAMGGLTGAVSALRVALVSNPLTLLAVGAAAIIGVMVSLRERTDEATEAIERQRSAAATFAPISAALADAASKQASADMLGDSNLFLQSLEARRKAVEDTLALIQSGSAAGGTYADARRLVQTPEALQTQRDLNATITGDTPQEVGDQMRRNVPTILRAEWEALGRMIDEVREKQSAAGSGGADVEAQRAKLQALLDVMRDEGAQLGQDSVARAVSTQRRALEAGMTEKQKSELAPLLDQLGEQATLNAQGAKAAEDSARAHEAYAKSIEDTVAAGEKAGKTLQAMIDKTALEIATLSMTSRERAVYVARLEAERLAEESGTLAAYQLVDAYVAQIDALQEATAQKRDYEAVTQAAAESERRAALAQLEALANVNDYLDSLEREVELAGLDADAKERQEASQRALNLAVEAGYNDETTAKLRRVAEAYTSVAQKTREARQFADELGQDGAGFLTRLTESTLSWKSAMEAARDTAKNLLQTFLQYAAIQPIAQGLAQIFMPLAGAVVGGAVGPPGSAGGGSDLPYGNRGGTINAFGNAFHGGAVIPFATGGAIDRGRVYDSPTVAPMAMFGEGPRPEAIMPLERGPGGFLGVRAAGAGGQSNSYNVSVSVDARGNASGADAMRRSARHVAEAVSRSLSR